MLQQSGKILRGFTVKYRCSKPSCRKVSDTRELAEKCHPGQMPVYHFPWSAIPAKTDEVEERDVDIL